MAFEMVLRIAWQLVPFEALLSTSAGLWMIWHLWRARKDVGHRLFWKQLLALTCCDLLQSSCNVIAMQTWFQGSVSGMLLRFISAVLAFFDSSSCFFECSIAIGFVAAATSCTSFRSLLRLRYTVPVCIVLNTGIFLVLPEPWRGSRDWSVTILAYVLLTLAAYLCGLIVTFHGPSALRRRVCARALSYMAAVFVTNALPAILMFVANGYYLDASDRYAALEVLTELLICLNGFVNALVYAVWFRGQREFLRTADELESSLSFVFFDLDPLWTR